MHVSVDTQSEAWTTTVNALLADGVRVAPRGIPAVEMPEPWTVTIRSPAAGFVGAVGRTFRHAVSAVEGLSLVGQTSVPELQVDRVKALGSFMSGGVFRGSYGPRAEGALDDVVELLKRDRDSRQAVVSLYDSRRDLGRWNERSVSGDVPCTIAIHFLVRASMLRMWVTMRSQDAWLGLPYDLGQFSILQFAVAQALDVSVGEYTHSVGSEHLYEKDRAAALRVGAPDTRPVGWTFGGSGDVADTAARCRRILLGQHPPDESYLEAWLAGQLT